MESKAGKYIFLGGSERGFYGTLVKREAETPPPPPQWTVPEMKDPPADGPACAPDAL